MRILMLFTAVWGLWGMPILCQSGVWAECCGQRAPVCQEIDSNEQDRPEERDSDCDCPGCLEVCNARVIKQAGNTNVPVVSTASPVAVLSLSGVESALADHFVLTDQSPYWECRLKLPYAPSDRPLLL